MESRSQALNAPNLRHDMTAATGTETDRGCYELVREQIIPLPLEQVFAFFSDPFNLEEITPSFLEFRVMAERPLAVQEGLEIDYELKLWGLPVRWRSRIVGWQPRHHFVDMQLKGPYAHWHHTHEFEDLGGATRMRDRVLYRLPMGPVGKLAHVLFVKRSLNRIFDHRRSALGTLFEAA